MEDDVFTLTLDRESLDKLVNHLSDIDVINISVSEEGEVVFDIPSDSKVDIQTINIMDMVYDELDDLRHHCDNLKEGGKKRNELELKFNNWLELSEIFGKKLNDQLVRIKHN